MPEKIGDLSEEEKLRLEIMLEKPSYDQKSEDDNNVAHHLNNPDFLLSESADTILSHLLCNPEEMKNTMGGHHT